ncbi:MAG: CPBP family intramembrane glutamic endopeptidase [Vitreimonas sp.]
MSEQKSLADRVKWLFVGPKGVRLPWSILLVLLAFGAAAILSVVLLQAAGVHQQDVSTADLTAIGTIKTSLLALAALIAATLFMAVIEKRPLDDYYLGGAKPMLRAAQGAGIGLALIALLIGAQVAFGALKFEGFAIQGVSALIYGAEWAGAFVLVALLEEMTFRGYLLARLERSFGFRVAAIVMTVLFSAAHYTNAGESWLGLTSVVLVGLVFCYAIWKTGSLWWTFGFHAAWNWGETYLFGTADSGMPANGSLMRMHAQGADWLSGGATGPEGSVLCFGVLALAGLCVHFLLPKRDAISGSRGASRA